MLYSHQACLYHTTVLPDLFTKELPRYASQPEVGAKFEKLVPLFGSSLFRPSFRMFSSRMRISFVLKEVSLQRSHRYIDPFPPLKDIIDRRGELDREILDIRLRCDPRLALLMRGLIVNEVLERVEMR